MVDDSAEDAPLLDASRAAFEASAAGARELGLRLARSARSLGQTANASWPGETHPVVRQLSQELSDSCGAAAAKLEELVAARVGASEKLRPMFYGESGVGKSTLHAAIMGLDGSGVSDGRLNFTRGVDPVDWGGCLVTDMPGFNGADTADVDPEALHRLAVAELARADLVLLCFVDTNQKDSEFREFATEVIKAGKPAAAVLNVRGSMWRRPYEDACATVADRRRYSDDVLEQAHRVRSQLARYGLAQAPVIAVQAQLAAFARCRPYQAQDPVAQGLIIGTHGEQAVLRWSNLPVLEELLREAIGRHGVELRLGSYKRLVIAKASGLAAELRRLAARLDASVADLEGALSRMMAIAGRPKDEPTGFDMLPVDDEQRQELRAAYARMVSAVHRLEKLREVPLTSVSRGSAHAHADFVAEAALGPLHQRALSNVDSLVAETMVKFRKRKADEVRRAVFAEVPVDDVVTEAYGEFCTYLRGHVETISVPLPEELDTADEPGLADISGRRGRAGRLVGRVVPLAGGIAAIAFWNPLGWVAALVGIGASVLGTLLMRWGQKRREESRNEMRRALREAVDGYFAEQRRMFAGYAGLAIDLMAAESGLPGAEAATGVRLMSVRARAHALEFEALAESLGEPPSGPAIISAAARSVLERLGAGRADAEYQVFLGEDWCDDPYGLRAAGSSFAVAPEEPTDPADLVVGTRLRQSLTELAAWPPARAGQDWLDRATEALGKDRRARHLLRRLAALSRTHQPEIVICGNYDTGKSSLIARLFAERGIRPPEGLETGVSPTTAAATTYDWEGYRLVDTPGFDSGIASHTQATLAAIPTAAVVFYLFTPDLGGGDRRDFRALLVGDDERGQFAKIDRTIFVVNRSDLHGVDPRTDPRGFAECCRAKETELLDVVGQAVPPSARVGPWRVVSTASRPRWTRGEARPWDGMAEFAQALIDARPALTSQSVDVTLLHYGIRELGELIRGCDTEIEKRTAAQAAARQTIGDIDALIESAQALQQARRQALHRLVYQFLEEGLADIEGAITDDERRERVTTLEQFGRSPELLRQVEAWQSATLRAVQDWCRHSAQQWDARDSSLSQAGVATAQTLHLARSAKLLGIGEGGAVAAAALRGFAAKFGQLLTRLGKFARLGGRAAPVVGIGAAALEGLLDWHSERRHEQQRQDQIQNLYAAGTLYAKAILDVDTVLPALVELCDRLGRDRHQAAEAESGSAGPLRELKRHRDTYAGLTDDARVALTKGPR